MSAVLTPSNIITSNNILNGNHSFRCTVWFQALNEPIYRAKVVGYTPTLSHDIVHHTEQYAEAIIRDDEVMTVPDLVMTLEDVPRATITAIRWIPGEYEDTVFLS